MTAVGEEVEAAGEVGRRMTGRRPARRALHHVVLGAHLRKLRERRGVSTARIAAHFDVSQALLIKVENGRRAASPASLAMYCEVLGPADAGPLGGRGGTPPGGGRPGSRIV
ncbi:helix-turn-helix domain-containing protein [Saccharothrix yanglingensis]|uniref:HTH cro/C1-type domain-containing protein n=1 Tax=Saccharothrix yanglingensis TaxID=659496 RepID=A0ABU0WSV2_9PSEU|nr:helix-turn-helix transcriptional regulator [Saccharothrix yanglingensis]MDQ2582925.1 hypothetical protein [Saccharothrix yanglingensis]